jgi:RNA polymerase sigma-70 factor (sigma-E family)
MIAIVHPTNRSTSTDAALAEAYGVHYRSLVRLASLLVDDVGTCEEIVQEAFAKAVVRSGSLRDPDRLAPYLRSAVLNGARSHLRHRRVVSRHLSPVDRPHGAADAQTLIHDDQAAVLAALRTLPDRQREVLVLRYWMDLSEAEIATTLGVSAGSVKTHAHRGIEALAAKLGDRR